MKLKSGEERYCVNCHTDDCGYTSDDSYAFESKEELENFLGINNDYKNHIYKYGTDVFGSKRSLGSCEFVDSVYMKVEFEVDWN